MCCGDTESRTRHILILEKEALKISEVIMKPADSFTKHTSGLNPYVYEIKKTSRDGKCLFLKGNECQIYDFRPLVCRFYPFELNLEKNGIARFAYTIECPGMGIGNRLCIDYFKDLIKQAKHEFPKENDNTKDQP
jgi:Fe-S-cluster containining protein